MANSLKSSTLTMLSKQISRSDNEIIAFRKNKPLFVSDLKKQVQTIVTELDKHTCPYWALTMQDSFNFVSGLLALLYSGKHPLLLNPFHQEMTDYYQALLTDDIRINQTNFSHHQIVNIDQLNDINCDGDLSSANFKHDTLTLFTSGSTGLPKPIEKSVFQLENESLVLMFHWRDQHNHLSSELFIASVSHEHMYGLTFKIMLALSSKTPFVCEQIQYQEQLSTYKDKKIIYITTPSIIKTLDNKLEPIICDKVISAGGNLSFEEAQVCKQNFSVLPDEIYGSSETGVIATRKQTQPKTTWQLFTPMKIVCHEAKLPLLTSPLLNTPEYLNDKIELIDEQHFHLNGRVDKIIKISEKRVSLTYIENLLSQLAEVEQVMIVPLEQKNRTILGAAIRLSVLGKQRLQQYNHFKLSQYFRQQLKDKLSLVELPKKWRFIEAFPINSQGKSSYIELKTLFETIVENVEKIMNKKLPQQIDMSINHNQADIKIYVQPDLFWFKGHFTSQPLLPGVVQLNWVLHYAKQIFGASLALVSIDVIKFQIPVLPEDHLTLHLDWNEKTQKLLFSYTVTNTNALKIASSGKLTLCQ